jgi:hypothetical protein
MLFIDKLLFRRHVKKGRIRFFFYIYLTLFATAGRVFENAGAEKTLKIKTNEAPVFEQPKICFCDIISS